MHCSGNIVLVSLLRHLRVHSYCRVSILHVRSSHVIFICAAIIPSYWLVLMVYLSNVFVCARALVCVALRVGLFLYWNSAVRKDRKLRGERETRQHMAIANVVLPG